MRQRLAEIGLIARLLCGRKLASCRRDGLARPEPHCCCHRCHTPALKSRRSAHSGFRGEDPASTCGSPPAMFSRFNPAKWQARSTATHLATRRGPGRPDRIAGPLTFPAGLCVDALPRSETQCRLCVGRFKLLRNKRTMQIKQHRKEIADMLRAGKQVCVHVWLLGEGEGLE